MNKKEFALLLYKNNPAKFREYFKAYGNTVALMISKATKGDLQKYFNKYWNFGDSTTNDVLQNFRELYMPVSNNENSTEGFDWGSVTKFIIGGSEGTTNTTETASNTGAIIAGSIALAIIVAVVIWKVQ